MVAKEITKAGLTFCCLQEVKYLNCGKKLIRLDTGENFEFHWCGKKKRREAGVGILIRVDPNICIKENDIQDPRIMAMDLKLYGFNIRLVNAYAPTNSDGTENQKDLFYRQLKKACEKQEKHQKLIVAGDFNASTSLAFQKCHYNGTNVIHDDDCNDNGTRLKSFCRYNKLCIASTFFEHQNENRYTWYSPDKKTKKINDYVLTEPYVQQYVTDCVAKPDYDFDSDHCLLQTSLDTPMTRKARWKKRTERARTLNAELLEDRNSEKKFHEIIKNHLNNKEKIIRSPDEMSMSITETLISAAESVLPATKKKHYLEVWKEDQELNDLLYQRKQIRQHKEEYRCLNKAIKNV